VDHEGLNRFIDELPGGFVLMDVATTADPTGPAGEILDADRVDGRGDVLGDALDRDLAEDVLCRLFGFGPQGGMGVEQCCECAGVLATGELVEGRRWWSLGAPGGHGQPPT